MSLVNYIDKPILHIATDEKFFDATFKIYEHALPGKNQFLIIHNSPDEEMQYVSENDQFIFVYVQGDYLNKISQLVQNAQYVIFHGMNNYQSEIVNTISDKSTIVWSVFGGEVYNNPKYFGNSIYGPKTFKEFLGFKYKVKNFFRSIYYQLFKNRIDRYKAFSQAVKKVDIVSVLSSEELKLFKTKGLVKSETKQLKFTYYPLDVIIDSNTETIKNDNILLGNSATYTNNHLEAFEILKKNDIGQRKILTPLSYGDDSYRDDIIEVGEKLFNENFTPMTSFLPLKEYHQLLLSCGFVIMNHYRQQAVGNILTALYMGAKVFLSEKNVIYHYLKRKQCFVYSIENHLNGSDDPFTLLEKNEIKRNRQILHNEISLEAISSHLRNQFH